MRNVWPAGTLNDAFEIAYLYANTSTTSNLTSNTGAPSGTAASIVSFTLPGSATPLAPGSTPVNVTDPSNGKLAGSLTLQPDGTFVFTAAADYSGKLTVLYTVGSSDGQRVNSTLELNVIPGLARRMEWCAAHTLAHMQAFPCPKQASAHSEWAHSPFRAGVCAQHALFVCRCSERAVAHTQRHTVHGTDVWTDSGTCSWCALNERTLPDCAHRMVHCTPHDVPRAWHECPNGQSLHACIP